ncbi:hypothetical protein NA57DRAFT_75375 [Rhizodiscina lignyota]|uniref:Heterokaryon incompatibility domain-containing protein n=1 Tax=Rhizodiscina lignyota TaxID=1504668 RepID=A0A9P4IIF7_9PEZI|nr:hypothetical protein NA57DRAFT_75375 [Rhizodiscina lignyota]
MTILIAPRVVPAQLPAAGHKQWKGLEFIYWRCWWNQAWIVQEISLARKAVFMCGETNLDAHDLFAAASFLHEHKLTNATMIDLTSAINLAEVRQACLENRKLDLFTLLISTRMYRASDKRDRIYSLLGLCTDEDASTIIPDYAMSAAEVYTNFARRLLNRGTLDVLTAVGDFRRRCIPDLPSWVPDWSISSRTQEFLLPGKEISAAASKDSEAKLNFSGNLILHAAGLVFDTVVDTGLPFVFPYIDMQVAYIFSPMETMNRAPFQHAILNWFVSYWTAIRLDEWKGFLSRLKTFGYPTGEEASHIYLRTITADSYPVADLESAYSAYCKTNMLSKPDREVKVEEIQESATFRTHLDRACHGRRMFLTSRGYLGLGPLMTERGAKVVLLTGGKTPYILRKEKSGEYTSRGECYVHGIMRGEAWDESIANEEFRII